MSKYSLRRLLNKNFLFYVLIVVLILQPIAYEYYNTKIYREKVELLQLKDKYTSVVMSNSELEESLIRHLNVDFLLQYARSHNMILKLDPTVPQTLP